MAKEVTLEELKTYEGKELSPTDWFEINQERIDQFADCTDDHQYIHVDPERMKDSPYGSTIGHGFLSLSLVAGHTSPDWPKLKGAVLSLNYGLDKVRFLNPVKVNSRVRFHTKILSVQEKSPGRILVKAQKTLEIEGEDKPAMIAETLGMVVLG
ncbi:MAG: MaoC family dehydratase [Verrucomicrobia bacterium]|nr:MaoC family dehydratase [Verrucomicrobiota bacterium]